jgi:glycerol-3-phosphate dehydrogenase
MSQTVDVDIAILGGGIAGLWLLNRLLKQGYNAVLFEQGDLGGQQTIASQGMIHGGIKYALGGALTGASEAIADMPNHWRRCLNGEGDVDLRQAKVLSEHFYMWSTASITSRVTSFFASKVTRGRVDSLSKSDYPPPFQGKHFKGSVYKLVDLVLDVPSVVQTLSDNAKGRVFSIDWQQASWQQHSNGEVSALKLNNELSLRAKRFILSAGKGNGAMMAQLGIEQPAMQLRPLQQVLVKHDYPHPLYAHCMGSNPSPRLTISSHATCDGHMVWYLGGDLATEGTELPPAELIANAKAELNDLFPHIDWQQAQWATLKIDRAEPRQKGLVKPDKAFAATAKPASNVIVAWPTKLTLAPNMADEVEALLQRDNISASGGNVDALASLPTPAVGTPCWDTLFDAPV